MVADQMAEGAGVAEMPQAPVSNHWYLGWLRTLCPMTRFTSQKNILCMLWF